MKNNFEEATMVDAFQTETCYSVPNELILSSYFYCIILSHLKPWDFSVVFCSRLRSAASLILPCP